MKIEQAMKIIDNNLLRYIDPVPLALLKRIKDVIVKVNTVTKPNTLKHEKPDLAAEWDRICKEYEVDSEAAMKLKTYVHVSIRCHFVRYVLTEYDNAYISLSELGRFLGRPHHMIIYYRDFAKVECPIPQMGISKWNKHFKKV
jgi:hypothetical protein